MKKKANIEKVVMDGSRRGTDVIGDDETIRFWVGEDIYLECHIKDGRLNVRSTPVGSSWSAMWFLSGLINQDVIERKHNNEHL